MNQELREHLGKVAFNATTYGINKRYHWDIASEDVREHFRREAEAVATEVVRMQEFMTLEELRPGALFVTEDGTYAVKSEYWYSGENPQYECVLLESGEYAHFRDGNRTRVREVFMVEARA